NQLLMMKKPLKCTWNEEETGAGKVSNVMYINGEKFYQDVTVGEMGHSYALNDGEYIYTWNDFNSQATKVSIKLAEKSSTVMTNRENSDGYGLEQRRTFTCEEWSVDNNIFVLPLDKDFKDMNEQVEQTVNKMEQEADAYKQVCDMCTRASTKQLRDDCAKKFGCN
ncbi:MAG TPA: hypothetical protein PKZ16_03460, partial [bacterium]|nr:hypothetical protein [bacterium]